MKIEAGLGDGGNDIRTDRWFRESARRRVFTFVAGAFRSAIIAPTTFVGCREPGCFARNFSGALNGYDVATNNRILAYANPLGFGRKAVRQRTKIKFETSR